MILFSASRATLGLVRVIDRSALETRCVGSVKKCFAVLNPAVSNWNRHIRRKFYNLGGQESPKRTGHDVATVAVKIENKASIYTVVLTTHETY